MLMRTLALALAILLLASGADARCTGDCGGGGGEVSIDELVLGVNVALGEAPPDACPAFPACAIGPVCIADLIRAVRNALEGCPAPVLPFAALAFRAPASRARPGCASLFASPVDPSDFSDLVAIRCGEPPITTAVRITTLSPTTLLLDPAGASCRPAPPARCRCPADRFAFTVAAAGAAATIHYDRADKRRPGAVPRRRVLRRGRVRRPARHSGARRPGGHPDDLRRPAARRHADARPGSARSRIG